jgi:uncharacterized protein (TIGR03790 family)
MAFEAIPLQGRDSLLLGGTMIYHCNWKTLILLALGLGGRGLATAQEATAPSPGEAPLTGGSATLNAAHLAIIANGQVPESRELARYYAQRRGVPEDRIILLDVPFSEDIERAAYDEKVAAGIRRALVERGLAEQVHCLVTVYGVPLRLRPVPPSEAQMARIREIRPQFQAVQAALKEAQAHLRELQAANPPAPAEELQSWQQKLTALQKEHEGLQEELSMLHNGETQAALDSELSLLWWQGYGLYRWLINPLHFRASEEARKQAPPTLMVARLDAATPELARGLVDQALAAEREGLRGTFYIDARGLRYDPQTDPTGSGYSGYDESLRELARLLQAKSPLPVVLDDREELFPPGSCPDAALYCGWYSVGHYVDAFTWVRGAVAYHIASLEATTLHAPESPVWCNQMLQRGVAATLGPVAEPYLAAFPRPAEFFGFLLTGRWTLVECYYRTLAFNSWMMTLLGDPLYNPFRDHPQLSPEDVQPSPLGSQPLWEKEKTDAEG